MAAFRKSNRLLPPWIVNHLITAKESVISVPRLVHIVEQLDPIPSGKLKQITDGEVYIVAWFTEEAVKLATKQMKDEDSELNWTYGLVLLNESELVFVPHLNKDRCMYIIKVKKFVIWDQNPGFSRKNRLNFCMDVASVKESCLKYWTFYKNWKLTLEAAESAKNNTGTFGGHISMAQVLAVEYGKDTADTEVISMLSKKGSTGLLLTETPTQTDQSYPLSQLLEEMALPSQQVPEVSSTNSEDLLAPKLVDEPPPARLTDSKESASKSAQPIKTETSPVQSGKNCNQGQSVGTDKEQAPTSGVLVDESLPTCAQRNLAVSQDQALSQRDSYSWHQEEDSVNFSCSDESLDFGSPQAKSTQTLFVRQRSKSGTSRKSLTFQNSQDPQNSQSSVIVIDDDSPPIAVVTPVNSKNKSQAVTPGLDIDPIVISSDNDSANRQSDPLSEPSDQSVSILQKGHLITKGGGGGERVSAEQSLCGCRGKATCTCSCENKSKITHNSLVIDSCCHGNDSGSVQSESRPLLHRNSSTSDSAPIWPSPEANNSVVLHSVPARSPARAVSNKSILGKMFFIPPSKTSTAGTGQAPETQFSRSRKARSNTSSRESSVHAGKGSVQDNSENSSWNEEQLSPSSCSPPEENKQYAASGDRKQKTSVQDTEQPQLSTMSDANTKESGIQMNTSKPEPCICSRSNKDSKCNSKSCPKHRQLKKAGKMFRDRHVDQPQDESSDMQTPLKQTQTNGNVYVNSSQESKGEVTPGEGLVKSPPHWEAAFMNWVKGHEHARDCSIKESTVCSVVGSPDARLEDLDSSFQLSQEPCVQNSVSRLKESIDSSIGSPVSKPDGSLRSLGEQATTGSLSNRGPQEKVYVIRASDNKNEVFVLTEKQTKKKISLKTGSLVVDFQPAEGICSAGRPTDTETNHSAIKQSDKDKELTEKATSAFQLTVQDESAKSRTEKDLALPEVEEDCSAITSNAVNIYPETQAFTAVLPVVSDTADKEASFGFDLLCESAEEEKDNESSWIGEELEREDRRLSMLRSTEKITRAENVEESKETEAKKSSLEPNDELIQCSSSDDDSDMRWSLESSNEVSMSRRNCLLLGNSSIEFQVKRESLKRKRSYRNDRGARLDSSLKKSKQRRMLTGAYDSESDVEMVVNKTRTAKAYSPEKFTVDGHNVGNKIFWSNIVKAPFHAKAERRKSGTAHLITDKGSSSNGSSWLAGSESTRNSSKSTKQGGTRRESLREHDKGISIGSQGLTYEMDGELPRFVRRNQHRDRTKDSSKKTMKQAKMQRYLSKKTGQVLRSRTQNVSESTSNKPLVIDGDEDSSVEYSVAAQKTSRHGSTEGKRDEAQSDMSSPINPKGSKADRKLSNLEREAPEVLQDGQQLMSNTPDASLSTPQDSLPSYQPQTREMSDDQDSSDDFLQFLSQLPVTEGTETGKKLLAYEFPPSLHEDMLHFTSLA